MQSALGQKLGRREITEAEYGEVRKDIENDVAQGVFISTVVDWVRVFARAEELAVKHGSATLCRSFDTLHDALALELGVTEFCTFDTRQATMARAAGLYVVQ